MKRSIIFLATALSLISATFLFSSCEDIHAPIFYYINNEVALEEYGIVGDISGIIEFNGNLYVNSGRIYKKAAQQSSVTGKFNQQWSKLGSLPGRMFGLAADANNLYSIKITTEQNTSTGTNTNISRQLYYSTDGTTWTAIDNTSDVLAVINDKYTNAAYARKADGLYTLSGGTVGGSPASGTSSTTRSVSNGKFFTGASAYSSAKAMYYMAEASNPTRIYWSTDGSYADTQYIDPGIGKILSLEVTSDYLLVGTERVSTGSGYRGGGIYRIAINSDGSLQSTPTAFSNNAQSLMGTNYSITSIFALNNNENEEATDIYAAANIEGSFGSSSHATFEDIGLKAYYPARGTWNRDGTSDRTTTPKGN